MGPVTDKPKAERTGRCTALRTGGKCLCPAWVKGRTDGIWTSCAECSHTQQVHAKVEVAS